MLKSVDGQRTSYDVRRTVDQAYIISSPCEPSAQVS